MELAVGVRDRIFDAANLLYEEAGRLLFPTVDAVRKRARVNMNDASTTMKEWRRAQTMHVTPVTVEVPPTLQKTSSAALTEIWLAAVNLANESLRTAQAGWDAERAEYETLAQQMASAFEDQATELEAANGTISQLRTALSNKEGEAANMKGLLDDTSREIDKLRIAADQADAKSIEIERRASDLRLELNHAHQLAAAASEERIAMQMRCDDEIESLRAQLSKLKSETDLECARAQAVLTSAIETAAKLRGQVETLTTITPFATNRKPRKPQRKAAADS